MLCRDFFWPLPININECCPRTNLNQKPLFLTKISLGCFILINLLGGDKMKKKPTQQKTYIVNLIAGPGCGKSTNAARVFSELKDRGVNVELVSEYAKDLVWHERYATLSDELYIFAKQNHKIHMLIGKVDVIITDAPIILKLFYMPKAYDFSELVLKVFNQYSNLNFFLKRVKPYSSAGRTQTEAEAIEIDNKLIDLLKRRQIPIKHVEASELGAAKIVEEVMDVLNFVDKGQIY